MPLEYTIDKNPEYNMHHPKFAETFKQTMSPSSMKPSSPDRAPKDVNVIPMEEKLPEINEEKSEKPKVKSKKPKKNLNESDDELAFLG